MTALLGVFFGLVLGVAITSIVAVREMAVREADAAEASFKLGFRQAQMERRDYIEPCGKLVQLPNSSHADWCQERLGHEGECVSHHWDNAGDDCWCDK